MNIKKMEKLLRLTASDQEEEARTAAFMLCKLLREADADLRQLATPVATGNPMTDPDAFRKAEAAYNARKAERKRYEAQHREVLRKRQEEWQKEVRAQRERAREERQEKVRKAKAENSERIKSEWTQWRDSF